jgi:antirestriction protein ArdC
MKGNKMKKIKTPDFSSILVEAVQNDGMISSAYSKFHRYSINNQLLAFFQCMEQGIDVGGIATYKKWQELGRQVKKGSKAIGLYMPVSYKKIDEETGKEKNHSFFAYKNSWFVFSQTEGETNDIEDAEIPNFHFQKALDELAIKKVKFEQEDYNCQGYAMKNKIAINPLAEFPHKTFFHEVAHNILGHTDESQLSDNDKTPMNIREIEAESVAYILLSILNLDGKKQSRGYIQHWLENEKISDQSTKSIFKAADKILKAGAV